MGQLGKAKTWGLCNALSTEMNPLQGERRVEEKQVCLRDRNCWRLLRVCVCVCILIKEGKGDQRDFIWHMYED